MSGPARTLTHKVQRGAADSCGSRSRDADARVAARGVHIPTASVSCERRKRGDTEVEGSRSLCERRRRRHHSSDSPVPASRSRQAFFAAEKTIDGMRTLKGVRPPSHCLPPVPRCQISSAPVMSGGGGSYEWERIGCHPSSARGTRLLVGKPRRLAVVRAVAKEAAVRLAHCARRALLDRLQVVRRLRLEQRARACGAQERSGSFACKHRTASAVRAAQFEQQGAPSRACVYVRTPSRTWGRAAGPG